MASKLCLLVCKHYLREAEAAVSAGGFKDISVLPYAAYCSHPQKARDELTRVIAAQEQTGEDVLLVGGCFLPGPDALPGVSARQIVHVARCFDMFADPEIVDAYTQAGAYMLTPGWLAEWPDQVAEWGFDQPTARAFFAESAEKLVLLDTGIDAESGHRLKEFAEFVGLPSETVPVGKSHFRLFLGHVVADWRQSRLEAEATAAKQLAANYAMAFDLLGDLTRVMGEANAIEAILNLFAMLFAPGRLGYLAFGDGLAGESHARQATPVDLALLQRWLETAADKSWLETETGFYLRISHDSQTVGALVVEAVAFPEYKRQYLNLALHIAQLCGLAITRARVVTAQKEAEAALARQAQELARANAELERRVEARTSDLRQANEALTRALRVKSEFLAAMSHELRTPLTGVLGMADALQAGVYGPLAEPQVRPMEMVRHSGQRLLELVTDVLDYTALDAGLRLDLDDTPIEEVCGISLRAAQKAAQARQIRLTFQSTAAVATVWADAHRLKQMLLKLLQNAIKFTPEGGEAGLEVADGPVAGDTPRPEVWFTVWDHGIGIAPADQARLFQPFVQLDSSLARQYEGAGLGLAMVRRLAELQGGRIRVASEGTPGLGARFTLCLPALPPG